MPAIDVTTTDQIVWPTSDATNLLVLQNPNTDADMAIGYGTSVTFAGASNAGIFLSRYSGTGQYPTLVFDRTGSHGAINRPFRAIHNGSGTKPLLVNAIQ